MLDLTAKQGATAPTLNWRERLRVWRKSHRYFARQSARRLMQKPLATLLTLLMLAIAIALPTLMYVALQNVARWTDYSDAGLEITAYLHTPAGADSEGFDWQAHAQPLSARISRLEGVDTVEFISPARALERLEAIVGQSSEEIIQSLPRNPLPAAMRIVVDKKQELASTADRLEKQLATLHEVESVSVNLDWFRKAQAMVDLAARINLAVSLLLGLGVVLVIGNVVRVAIDSRRDEILVAKLVGATDAYARRPFLYLGLWLGAAGAVVALALSAVSV